MRRRLLPGTPGREGRARRPARSRAAAPLLALLLGAAPSGAASSGPDGGALYAASCAICHGADGAGDTPAGRKMAIPRLPADLPPARVVQVVRADRRHQTVSKKLSDADLQAVATWVAALGDR